MTKSLQLNWTIDDGAPVADFLDNDYCICKTLGGYSFLVNGDKLAAPVALSSVRAAKLAAEQNAVGAARLGFAADLNIRAEGDCLGLLSERYYKAGNRIMALGDELARLFTAARDLNDLMGERGSTYVPTIRPMSEFHILLADVFDAVAAARGESRRAWRGN